MPPYYDGQTTRKRSGRQLRFPDTVTYFQTSLPDGLLPTCEEAGVLGALTGVIGSMQALEIIKEVTGTGDSLAGRLILYDAKACRFQEISYSRRRGNLASPTREVGNCRFSQRTATSRNFVNSETSFCYPIGAYAECTIDTLKTAGHFKIAGTEGIWSMNSNQL